MNTGELENVIVPLILTHGFRKKGGLFLRPNGGITHVISLTRSRFGPQIIVELGVLHPEVPFAPNVPLSWHVNTRLDAVASHRLGRKRSEVSAPLDGDANLTVGERTTGIEELLRIGEDSFFKLFLDTSDVEDYAINGGSPDVYSPASISEFAHAKMSGRQV